MRGCDVTGCAGAHHGLGLCHKHYRRRQRSPEQFEKFGRYNTHEEKFWLRVDKGGDCWLWITGKNAYGYGQFGIGHKKFLAHRFAYELTNGPIPEGLSLDHRCHVLACVNPDHLRPVTQKQNNENRGAPSKAISGALGVRWIAKTGRWAVYVKHDRQTHYGGVFGSRDEAAEAARQLRLSLFTHNDLDRRTA